MTETGKGPARGYRWPSFESDNTASVTHGARSKRALSPIAAELRSDLAALAPWTARPTFAAAVEAWAYTEATCVLYRRWFDEHGLFEDEDSRQAGVPLRPGLERWSRAEARAERLRSRLGLDPQALVKLLAGTAEIATATGDTESLRALEDEGRELWRLHQGSDAALPARHSDAAVPGTGAEALPVPEQPEDGADA